MPGFDCQKGAQLGENRPERQPGYCSEKQFEMVRAPATSFA